MPIIGEEDKYKDRWNGTTWVSPSGQIWDATKQAFGDADQASYPAALVAPGGYTPPAADVKTTVTTVNGVYGTYYLDGPNGTPKTFIGDPRAPSTAQGGGGSVAQPPQGSTSVGTGGHIMYYPPYGGAPIDTGQMDPNYNPNSAHPNFTVSTGTFTWDPSVNGGNGGYTLIPGTAPQTTTVGGIVGVAADTAAQIAAQASQNGISIASQQAINDANIAAAALNQKNQNLFTGEQNALNNQFTGGQNALNNQFSAGQQTTQNQFTAGQDLVNNQFTGGENQLNRALTAGSDAANYQIAYQQAASQAQKDALAAATQYTALSSAPDLTGFTRFLAAGGGKAGNALAAGANAFTSLGQLGAARALNLAQNPAAFALAPNFSAYYTPGTNPSINNVNPAANNQNPYANTNPFLAGAGPTATVAAPAVTTTPVKPTDKVPDKTTTPVKPAPVTPAPVTMAAGVYKDPTSPSGYAFGGVPTLANGAPYVGGGNTGLDAATGLAEGVVRDANSPSGFSLNGTPVTYNGALYTGNGINPKTGLAEGVIVDPSSPTGYSHWGTPTTAQGALPSSNTQTTIPTPVASSSVAPTPAVVAPAPVVAAPIPFLADGVTQKADGTYDYQGVRVNHDGSPYYTGAGLDSATGLADGVVRDSSSSTGFSYTDPITGRKVNTTYNGAPVAAPISDQVEVPTTASDMSNASAPSNQIVGAPVNQLGTTTPTPQLGTTPAPYTAPAPVYTPTPAYTPPTPAYTPPTYSPPAYVAPAPVYTPPEYAPYSPEAPIYNAPADNGLAANGWAQGVTQAASGGFDFGGVPVTAQGAPITTGSGIDSATGMADGVVRDSSSASGFSYNGTPTTYNGALFALGTANRYAAGTKSKGLFGSVMPMPDDTSPPMNNQGITGMYAGGTGDNRPAYATGTFITGDSTDPTNPAAGGAHPELIHLSDPPGANNARATVTPMVPPGIGDTGPMGMGPQLGQPNDSGMQGKLGNLFGAIQALLSPDDIRMMWGTAPTYSQGTRSSLFKRYDLGTNAAAGLADGSIMSSDIPYLNQNLDLRQLSLTAAGGLPNVQNAQYGLGLQSPTLSAIQEANAQTATGVPGSEFSNEAGQLAPRGVLRNSRYLDVNQVGW